jgi:tRNA nucleotidyltransferase (CCA-adding enzyme)
MSASVVCVYFSGLILNYISNIIKRAASAQVFAHGSFALKTYLPDADLDVSAFFSRV